MCLQRQWKGNSIVSNSNTIIQNNVFKNHIFQLTLYSAITSIYKNVFVSIACVASKHELILMYSRTRGMMDMSVRLFKQYAHTHYVSCHLLVILRYYSNYLQKQNSFQILIQHRRRHGKKWKICTVNVSFYYTLDELELHLGWSQRKFHCSALSRSLI